MAAERVVLALTCILILWSVCDGQVVGSCGAEKSREFDKCSLVPLSFGGANLTFTASSAQASSYCKSVSHCVCPSIRLSFLTSLIKLINLPTTVSNHCPAFVCDRRVSRLETYITCSVFSVARNSKAAVACIKSFAKKCLTSLPRQGANMMAVGMLKSVRKVCKNAREREGLYLV